MIVNDIGGSVGGSVGGSIGGPGGWTPHMKGVRMLVGNFEFKP